MQYSKPRATHELHNFKDDSLAMTEEAFAARHGNGFLLHAGDLGAVAEDFSEQETVEDTPEQSIKRRGHFLVFPLGVYTKSRTIQLGSGEDNDVVLDHPSVAASHAMCVCEAGGEISLWRIAAEHATWTNDVPVPIHAADAPKQLVRNGASIRVGAVRLIYLNSNAFRTLVRRLLGPE